MTDAAAPRSEPEQPSFEQAFAELDRIVRELEEGQLGLSESLARYEQGVRYLKQCHDALRRAELRITVLTGIDADGNPVAEPFDDAVMSLQEKQESRGRRRSRSPAAKDAGTPPKSAGTADADVDNQRGLF